MMEMEKMSYKLMNSFKPKHMQIIELDHYTLIILPKLASLLTDLDNNMINNDKDDGGELSNGMG